MKWLATLVFLSSYTSAWAGDATQARLIGDYSNMQADGADDPHFISGYNVTLYKRNSITLAYVMVATGGPEPVRADIKQLDYDQKTHRLSFTAQYSHGRISNPVKGRPDYEDMKILTFRGLADEKKITGAMSTRTLDCSACKARSRHICLKRLKTDEDAGELVDIPD